MRVQPAGPAAWALPPTPAPSPRPSPETPGLWLLPSASAPRKCLLCSPRTPGPKGPGLGQDGPLVHLRPLALAGHGWDFRGLFSPGPWLLGLESCLGCCPPAGADSATRPGPPSCSAQPRPRGLPPQPPPPPPPSNSALHVPLTRVSGGGGARLPAASGQNTNLTTGGPAAPTPIKAIPPPVGLASLLSWGRVCVGVQGAPQASAQSLAPAPWPGVWSRALAKTRPWGHVSSRRNPG